MSTLQSIEISHTGRVQNRMQRLLHHRFLFIILLAAVTFLTFSASADAQIFGSVSSNFSCSAGGGGGQLLNSGGQCPSSYENGKIFSYFVCQIEKLISEVFGEFYCQLQTKLIDPMTAVITLAVVLFGIAFIVGIVPATAKDSMLFLFKVAVVWGFATQADLMIGIGYNFFMGGLKEGIAIVVGAIFQPDSGVGGFSPSGQGGEQIYEYMDTIFKKIITLSTESAGKGEVGAAGAAGGDQNFCKNAIFGALTLLLLAFPPLFIMGVFFLFKFVLFFLRAVLGYIYAVMGISFLVCLAPIFLSFFFWKATHEYYERWLAQISGFAIQMVVIFAFISFILSMNASAVGKDLLSLVVPYNKSVEAPGVRWPWKVCTICDFEIVDSNGKAVSGGKVPPTGSVRCKDNPGKPLNPGTLAGQPKTDDAGGGAALSGDMRNTLLKLATKVILSMLILMQVVLALFDVVPQMAAQLANNNRLLLVNNSDPLPGEQQITKAAEAFAQNIGSGQSITAASEAFKEQSKLAFQGWLANPI